MMFINKFIMITLFNKNNNVIVNRG